MKVLLDNLLRFQDGKAVALCQWAPLSAIRA
jgi:hypothetical protein